MLSIKKSTVTNCILFFLLASTGIANRDLFPKAGGLSIRYVYVVIVLSAGIFLFMSKSPWKIRRGDALYWFILISLCIVPFFPGISAIGFSFRQVKEIIFLFSQMALYVVVYNLCTRIDGEDALRIFRLFLPVFAASSLLIYTYTLLFGVKNPAIAQLGLNFDHLGFPRMNGWYSDANYFSQATFGYILMYMYYHVRYGKPLGVSGIITVNLCLLDIVLTNSRSGMLIIAGYFAFTALFFRATRGMTITTLVIAGLILAYFASNFSEYFEIAAQRLTQMGKEGSFLERQELAQIGIQSLISNPLGNGIGTQEQFYEKHFGIPRYAHNDFLAVGIEAGIFGLFIYALLYIKLLFQSDKLICISSLFFVIFLLTLSSFASLSIVPLFLGVFGGEIAKDKILRRQCRQRSQCDYDQLSNKQIPCGQF